MVSSLARNASNVCVQQQCHRSTSTHHARAMRRVCVCVEHGPSEFKVRRDPFELELEMAVDSAGCTG